MGHIKEGMSIEKRDSMLQDMRDIMYFHVHQLGNGRNEPKWRGKRVVKYPTDLILYAETIFENKPDWIIETGTHRGGSAMFLADMMTLAGCPGKVISVDIKPVETPEHPKVEYVIGSSIDKVIIEYVKSKISGNIMVVLDSSHKARHVMQELHYYSGLVSKGQYVVVEDCYTKDGNDYPPKKAVDWFLQRTKGRFVLEPREDKYLVGITRGGWLKRV
jgi:cephalosporin hydroxylase